ncbi:MAG: DUF58 domain-containing protein [Chloroflexota bacterium]|nr:DUF58 domain-containing protein [Chloroflexota bacterium]
MRSLHAVLISIALSAFLALQTGHALFYHITYLLVAAVLFSGIWAWLSVRGLRVERQTITPQTQVGSLAEERFVVRNNSRLPKLWLEVHDHSDLPGHRASFVINRLAPGKRYNWMVKTLCRQRGRFTLGPITITSSDPLDLFQITRHLSVTSHILVIPAALELASFQLAEGRVGGGDAARGRAFEITANVATVRDYIPGDAFKRIHWPSTARKSRLIVKEFELDPTAEVWLFLDLEERVQVGPREPPPSSERSPLSQSYSWSPLPNTEEYGVTLAASLARYFTRRNRAVGLVSYGSQRQWLKPAHGPRQLDRILELLALARAQGEVPLQRVLESEGARLGRSGLVCVITPAVETGWIAAGQSLARRGPLVTAFFVDPASFPSPARSAPMPARTCAGTGDRVQADRTRSGTGAQAGQADGVRRTGSGQADRGGIVDALQASGMPAFTLEREGIVGGQLMLSSISTPVSCLRRREACLRRRAR